LPKIWKGARKRKKTKKSLDESRIGNEASNGAKSVAVDRISIENELKVNSLDNEQAPSDASKSKTDVDLFKLFDNDEALSAGQKETRVILQSETTASVEEKDASLSEHHALIDTEMAQPTVTSKSEEPLEYETDDEVEFLKPYFIEVDEKESERILNGEPINNSAQQYQQSLFCNSLNLFYNPSVYWYQMDELKEFIKSSIKENKKSQNVKYLFLIDLKKNFFDFILV
jgi:hypothetical protein